MTRLTHGPLATERLAAKLAVGLNGGACLALDGELGSGKTQFVRGLLRGLGGDARTVSSPTFVLLNIYDTGRLTVYHLDAYRASGPEDFEGIGFPELLEQNGIVVVEWAGRIASLLPPGRIDVRFQTLGPRLRQITWSGLA